MANGRFKSQMPTAGFLERQAEETHRAWTALQVRGRSCDTGRHPHRALVLTADSDLSQTIKTDATGHWDAVVCSDWTTALALMERESWDVFAADSGACPDPPVLVAEVRERRPGMAVVVLLPEIDTEAAIEVFRSGADDLLQTPVSASMLLSVFDRVKEKRTPLHDSVLAIGAHPDDVELGIGGVLAAHCARGDEVAILTLSQGSVGGEAQTRKREAYAAARSLGATLFLGDLPDTAIQEAGNTVSFIEEVTALVRPTRVYVHSAHDTHQDHRNTFRATTVATRRVSSVFCYQSPSATVDFRPNRFEVIDGLLPAKLHAIAQYQSQAHTRSYITEETIRSTASYWGRYAQCAHAEPLEVIRDRGHLVRSLHPHVIESQWPQLPDAFSPIGEYSTLA